MNKLKLILFTLLFCFSCSFCNAQYLSELKVKRNIQDTVKSIQTLTEKSPILAGTLSFIVPGFALGQVYNGEYMKAILYVGISGLAFALFASGFDVGGGSGEHPTAYAGFVLFLGNWFYSTFEAIAAAEEINKQVKLKKYRSDILNKLKFGFTLNKNKELNLKFAFEL